MGNKRFSRRYKLTHKEHFRLYMRNYRRLKKNGKD